MRVFIAIDLPENVKKEIKKIQDKLPEFKGKKTEEENLHLTLKFLGEVEEDKVKEVKRRLGEIKIKKFEAGLENLGVFNPSFIKIVWLHLAGCERLQEEIDDKLKGLFKKEKRFMSHLTIARVKNVANKKEFLEKLREIKIPGIRFLVDNFKLKKSTLTAEKPIYEDLLKGILE